MVNFFSKNVLFSLRNGLKHIIFGIKRISLLPQLRQISLEIIDGCVDLQMQKQVFISNSNVELRITIIDCEYVFTLNKQMHMVVCSK